MQDASVRIGEMGLNLIACKPEVNVLAEVRNGHRPTMLFEP